MLLQARWTVKARCSSKTDIKRYSNQRGEGRVFSFDLVDKDKGEIRCTGFNDQCDKFFDKVEAGKIYTLTKGSVRPKRQGNVSTPHPASYHAQRAVISRRMHASGCSSGLSD